MSILIKGIELSTAGAEYFFSFEPDGKLYITNYHTGEEIAHGEVITIPTPHGRLIDADREYIDVGGECDDDYPVAFFIGPGMDKATILEAEE